MHCEIRVSEATQEANDSSQKTSSAGLIAAKAGLEPASPGKQ